jgi:hypothetical protein
VRTHDGEDTPGHDHQRIQEPFTGDDDGFLVVDHPEGSFGAMKIGLQIPATGR